MSKAKLLILTSNSHLKRLERSSFSHMETIFVHTLEECYYQLFKHPQTKFEAIFIVANELSISLKEIITCINSHESSKNRFFISATPNRQELPLENWKISDSFADCYKNFLEKSSLNLSWTYQFNDETQAKNDLEFQSLQHEYEVLLDGAGEGIIGLNEEGKITFANKTASDILGVTRNNLIGQPFTNFSDDSPLNLGSNASSFNAGQSGLRRVSRGIIRRGNGDRTYVEFTHSFVGNTTSVTVSIMVFEDISERVKFESKLIRLAHQDKLTGLYNRYYFEKSLRKELNNRRGESPPISIALIDLDGFKEINDRYGHVTGDKLLILIGKRIRECIRRSDLAARLGGDEFCIVFKDATEAELSSLLDKVRFNINAICDIDNQSINVTASIGLCTANSQEDIEHLLSRADKAMYRVKRNGKNGILKANENTTELLTG